MDQLLTYPGDLYTSPLKLWLDPGHVKDRAFVSHAHADHMGRHKYIIASPPTARLIEHRLDYPVDQTLAYEERIPMEEGHLTLHPSGHILGSAQAFVEWKGERLVYTGDFKLKPSRTAEPCQVIECDHLVMECTYGRPHYRFPDRKEVEGEILAYIEKVLLQKKTPLLLAYVLGRAQEMLKLLTEAGFPVAVENRIYDISKIYEELGVPLGDFERFNPEDYEGRVLVFPPHLWKSPVVKNIPERHTIAVTGWALDGRQESWYRSDAAFTLSDHADFDDLLRYIDQARPKKVSLIHGFQEFADHIKKLGVETEFLGGMA
ncbi:MAG: MBL fold metallo-hydrolase RNA specificity domain-containing protein [Planctomycetota bacterium]|jgi:Cft2 family RNA processing exonuclease